MTLTPSGPSESPSKRFNKPSNGINPHSRDTLRHQYYQRKFTQCGQLVSPTAQTPAGARCVVSCKHVQAQYRESIKNKLPVLAILEPLCQETHVVRNTGDMNASMNVTKVPGLIPRQPSTNLLRETSETWALCSSDLEEFDVRHNSARLRCQEPTTCSVTSAASTFLHMVMTTDVVSHVLKRLRDSDIANLRLVNCEWCRSISARVAKLSPSKFPPNNFMEHFPALSSLDLTKLGPQRMRKLRKVLLSCEGKLTRLQFGDNKKGKCSWVGNRDMNDLSSLVNLRKLELYNPWSLTSKGIQLLSSLTKLEEITLDKCKHISLSIAHICTMWPQLRKLRMGGCNISSQTSHSSDSITLNNSHQLSTLFLRSSSIDSKGFLRILNFSKLSKLYLEKVVFVDAIAGVTPATSAITQMSLVDTWIPDTVLIPVLKQMSCLAFLQLVHSGKPCRIISPLEHCLSGLKLQCLRLLGTRNSWKILIKIARVKKFHMTIPDSGTLQALDAQHCQVNELELHGVNCSHWIPEDLSHVRDLHTVVLNCEQSHLDPSCALLSSVQSLKNRLQHQCRIRIISNEN